MRACLSRFGISLTSWDLVLLQIGREMYRFELKLRGGLLGCGLRGGSARFIVHEILCGFEKLAELVLIFCVQL